MPMPPNISVFFFTYKANFTPTTQTPSREACLPFVGRVLPVPKASRKDVWLDWLAPTVRHGCERHAIISVVLEAFFRRIFSMSSDKTWTWTSAEGFMA